MVSLLPIIMISHPAGYSTRSRFRRLPNTWLHGLGLGIALFTVSGLIAADGTQSEARLKYEEPKSLNGAIYARGSDQQKLLFRFKRQATRSGFALRVVRDYTYPDGKPAAQEEVVYEGNNLVSFILRQFQIGAQGSAKIKHTTGSPAEGTIQFEYVKNPGSAAKLRSEALRENTLVGDMVAPFLAEHWDALMRGEKVRSRYIAVPRMETVGFTFVKDAASDLQEAEAVSIRMEPTSRIIAAIVDPLYFSIEQAPPHRVLRYNGRTTPKLNVRGKWEDLDAITVFDWK
jgi:hypothetical protein